MFITVLCLACCRHSGSTGSSRTPSMPPGSILRLRFPTSGRPQYLKCSLPASAKCDDGSMMSHASQRCCVCEADDE
jgi:hypothetical protein